MGPDSGRQSGSEQRGTVVGAQRKSRRAPGLATRLIAPALKLLLPVVLLVVIAVGGLYVRLLNGPISLDYLRQTISDSIAADLPELSAGFDDVELALSDGGFELRLTNIRLTNPSGAVVAYAPNAAIDLSTHALRHGQIAPQRISLVRPTLFAFYDRETGLSLSFSGDRAGDEVQRSSDRESHSAVRANLTVDAPAVATGASKSHGNGARGVRTGTSQVAGGGTFDVTKTLHDLVTTRPHKREASAYLRGFGLRAARLIIRHGARHDAILIRSLDVKTWRVAGGRKLTGELLLADALGGRIDFQAQPARADVDGNAGDDDGTVGSDAASEAHQFVAHQKVAVELTASNLNPSRVGLALPAFKILDALDLPLNAAIAATIASQGRIESATLHMDGVNGAANILGAGAQPVPINSASFDFRYDDKRQRVDMGPSRIVSDGLDLTLVGAFEQLVSKSASADPGSIAAHSYDGWGFSLNATDGWLGLSGSDAAERLKLQDLQVRGRYEGAGGWLRVQQARIGIAGGTISLAGSLDMAQSDRHRIVGEVSTVSLKALGKIWPKSMMPDPRAWFVTNVAAGQIVRGQFSVQSAGGDPAQGRDAGASPRLLPEISATLALRNLKFRGLEALPWISGRRADLKLNGDKVEIRGERATMRAGRGRTVSLSNLLYRQTRVWAGDRGAQASLKAASTVNTALAVLARPEFGIDAGDMLRRGADGEITADVKLNLPAPIAVSAAAREGKSVWPAVSGVARVSKGRLRHSDLPHQIDDGNFTIRFGTRAVDLSGDMRVGGVATQVTWQRFLNVASDENRSAQSGAAQSSRAAASQFQAPQSQPPLRLTARLTARDRKRLGLDVGNIIRGVTPIHVQVPRLHGRPEVDISLDLKDVEMRVESLGWVKPAGREARLNFRLIPAANGSARLADLKLVGERIAVQGEAGLDREGTLSWFKFPQFSLDLVSRLAIEGRYAPPASGSKQIGIWKVSASGTTVDGRDFFQGLFSVDNTSAPSNSTQLGLDVEASIDTVIGFNDTNLNGLQLSVSKRGGRIESLSARAKLNGKSDLEVAVQRLNRKRRLIATSEDAGSTFRLVRFYPTVRGGRMRLRIDLDGARANEKSGVLDVVDFEIFGDGVLRDVIQAPDPSAPAIARDRRGLRRQAGRQYGQEVIEFQRLRAPFSIGYGQFVVHDADLVGPLIGGSLRGKADFTERTVRFGGTYSFLQGLNSLPKFIPGIGQLLTGPRQEGISAMTFAIDGPMSAPDVRVNPFSPFMPGILRELMNLDPAQPQLQPRAPTPSDQQAGGDGDVKGRWRTSRPKPARNWDWTPQDR